MYEGRKPTASRRLVPGPVGPEALANVNRVLAPFDEWCAQQFSPRTCECYSAYARGFAMWMVRRGLGFADVHYADVQCYQGDLFAGKKLNGRPFASSTIAGKLEAVRCLFRFLLKHRYVIFDPCSSLEMPRVPRTPTC